jgi:hypothetical protein
LMFISFLCFVVISSFLMVIVISPFVNNMFSLVLFESNLAISSQALVHPNGTPSHSWYSWMVDPFLVLKTHHIATHSVLCIPWLVNCWLYIYVYWLVVSTHYYSQHMEK